MNFSPAVFFEFESDFVESLRCIPMAVRFKLDTCGIKLKLEQWHHFNEAERTSLVSLPCETPSEIAGYRKHLSELIWQHSQTLPSELPIDAQPPWQNQDIIPESVQQKADSVGIVLGTEQWQALTTLQRFALIKLSRSSHENRNFLPAWQEFQS